MVLIAGESGDFAPVFDTSLFDEHLDEGVFFGSPFPGVGYHRVIK